MAGTILIKLINLDKGKFEKGDVSGVECYRYHRGKDGLGTCNINCQWWPKDKSGNPLNHACAHWVHPDLQDTEKDIFYKDGKYINRTIEEFAKSYNTKIVIDGVTERMSITHH